MRSPAADAMDDKTRLNTEQRLPQHSRATHAPVAPILSCASRAGAGAGCKLRSSTSVCDARLISPYWRNIIGRFFAATSSLLLGENQCGADAALLLSTGAFM